MCKVKVSRWIRSYIYRKKAYCYIRIKKLHWMLSEHLLIHSTWISSSESDSVKEKRFDGGMMLEPVYKWPSISKLRRLDFTDYTVIKDYLQSRRKIIFRAEWTSKSTPLMIFIICYLGNPHENYLVSRGLGQSIWGCWLGKSTQHHNSSFRATLLLSKST